VTALFHFAASAAANASIDGGELVWQGLAAIPIEREIRKDTILASVAEDYSRMPASRVRRGARSRRQLGGNFGRLCVDAAALEGKVTAPARAVSLGTKFGSTTLFPGDTIHPAGLISSGVHRREKQQASPQPS